MLKRIKEKEIKREYEKAFEAKKVKRFNPPSLTKEVAIKERAGKLAIADAQLSAGRKEFIEMVKGAELSEEEAWQVWQEYHNQPEVPRERVASIAKAQIKAILKEVE